MPSISRMFNCKTEKAAKIVETSTARITNKHYLIIQPFPFSSSPFFFLRWIPQSLRERTRERPIPFCPFPLVPLSLNLRFSITMRKLCPNFDRQNGLETVLEVPIPEEMFTNMGSNGASRWANLRSLMKAQSADHKSSHLQAKSKNEFIALLKLVGAPLVPYQVLPGLPVTRPIQNCPIVCISNQFIIIHSSSIVRQL